MHCNENIAHDFNREIPDPLKIVIDSTVFTTEQQKTSHLQHHETTHQGRSLRRMFFRSAWKMVETIDESLFITKTFAMEKNAGQKIELPFPL